jgi:hypothetical protein
VSLSCPCAGSHAPCQGPALRLLSLHVSARVPGDLFSSARSWCAGALSDPSNACVACHAAADAAAMASAALETAQETAAVVGAKTAEGYKDASAGIDTMMNALIDKAALVTKHWKLRPEETAPPFYLTVRHYSMTKMYILSISGLLVLVNSKVVYRHTVRDPCHTSSRHRATAERRTSDLTRPCC